MLFYESGCIRSHVSYNVRVDEAELWSLLWEESRRQLGVEGDYGQGMTGKQMRLLMGQWLRYKEIYGLEGQEGGLTEEQRVARGARK